MLTTDRDGLTLALAPLPGLTLGQELRLRRLCDSYKVPFDPTHYGPIFDLPEGWVAGWVGDVGTTIYVGVAPNGESHS